MCLCGRPAAHEQGGTNLPNGWSVRKGGSLALISRVAGWRLSVAVSVPSVFCRYLWKGPAWEGGGGNETPAGVRFDVGWNGCWARAYQSLRISHAKIKGGGTGV